MFRLGFEDGAGDWSPAHNHFESNGYWRTRHDDRIQDTMTRNELSSVGPSMKEAASHKTMHYVSYHKYSDIRHFCAKSIAFQNTQTYI